MWLLPFLAMQTRQDLAFEIHAMAMADQEMRNRMMRMYPSFKGMTPKAFKEWEAVDRACTVRMKEIVSEIGWPDATKVGKEASGDAWLLVQHADQDPRFQRKCLNLLEPLLRTGSIRKQDYAMLFDRVAIAEHKKQRYGSQFYVVNGKWEMRPTEDPKNLDKRRKEMGMMPIAQYAKLLREMYKA